MGGHPTYTLFAARSSTDTSVLDVIRVTMDGKLLDACSISTPRPSRKIVREWPARKVSYFVIVEGHCAQQVAVLQLPAIGGHHTTEMAARTSGVPLLLAVVVRNISTL
jgi:hypothetical protein